MKKEEPKKEKKGNGLYIFLGLIIVAVVGLGYYFKIYKKNQEDDEDEEEYDEFEDPYEREDDENEMPGVEEKQEIEDLAIDAYDED